MIDPQGKFAAEVNADRDLGKSIKLDHTPTVYIVGTRNPDKPYVEMKETSQLYSLIDAMMKNRQETALSRPETNPNRARGPHQFAMRVD